MSMPCPVSITFRLSALSAQVWKDERKAACAVSQLPFGSVPFRHVKEVTKWKKISILWVSITFRLSALSALNGDAARPTSNCAVSITFRLSALSARSMAG